MADKKQEGGDSSKGRLHEQLAASLQTQIESGILRDGSVLPSGKALAEEWKVSVFTVSQAVQLLAERGLVKTKNRSRSIVIGPETLSKVRRSSPTVVLVAGHVGAGKSQFAKVLANESGWALLSKDILTKNLGGEILEASGDSPFDLTSSTYRERVEPAEIETLLDIAIENIECGNSVIVVSPLLSEVTTEEWIHGFQSTVESSGGLVEVVWVHAPESEMYRNLRKRGAAVDAVKVADWDGYLKQLDLEKRPVGRHSSVNGATADRQLRDQAQEILQEYISART